MALLTGEKRATSWSSASVHLDDGKGGPVARHFVGDDFLERRHGFDHRDELQGLRAVVSLQEPAVSVRHHALHADEVVGRVDLIAGDVAPGVF